jgi:hypothetical protein
MNRCALTIRDARTLLISASFLTVDAWPLSHPRQSARHPADLRQLDPRGARGVVIALSPKGRKAKRDQSGFVVR